MLTLVIILMTFIVVTFSIFNSHYDGTRVKYNKVKNDPTSLDHKIRLTLRLTFCFYVSALGYAVLYSYYFVTGPQYMVMLMALNVAVFFIPFDIKYNKVVGNDWHYLSKAKDAANWDKFMHWLTKGRRPGLLSVILESTLFILAVAGLYLMIY